MLTRTCLKCKLQTPPMACKLDYKKRNGYAAIAFFVYLKKTIAFALRMCYNSYNNIFEVLDHAFCVTFKRASG